ncbi:MAG TPA: DUF4097 family beta strand repeat-containing protein [Thermoanaerobaculia bacterium]|nr:DUF4097 family beta strand repeat-containing protein [Thermoanaerobaculia bacterium]
MRRHISLIALLVLIALSASASTDDVVRKGFNVTAGGRLTLEAGFGDVRIVTGGTGVAIEVVRRARTNDREDAAEIFRDHEISFDQNGNDVIVKARYDRDNHWFHWDNGLSVQWNIRVPAKYSVDVHTSGGDVKLTDVSGEVEVRTSGGDIDAGRVSGPTNLRTSGGDIAIDSASGNVTAHTSGGGITIGDTTGWVEAKTSGGSIHLARVSGDVTARTSGGGIKIEEAMGRVDASTSGGSITARFGKQPGGDSRLSTSGGGVMVYLAPNVAADLDARASGGGVHSDIPITVMGTQDHDSLEGKINGGGPRLVLRTSGGGITVTRM